MLTRFDYYEKVKSLATHIWFYDFKEMLFKSQERVQEAKSLAVKKCEGNNMRKQERENISYHQQD